MLPMWNLKWKCELSCNRQDRAHSVPANSPRWSTIERTCKEDISIEADTQCHHQVKSQDLCIVSCYDTFLTYVLYKNK